MNDFNFFDFFDFFDFIIFVAWAHSVQHIRPKLNPYLHSSGLGIRSDLEGGRGMAGAVPVLLDIVHNSPPKSQVAER